VGVSNFTVAQLKDFAEECPIAAYQPPYNMLQRQIESNVLPWCRENGVSVLVYWPLMKGLLAGSILRDHVFAATDTRRKYPMFHGEEWQKNQDLMDKLRQIASSSGRTVAQLVINWTIHQPGITSALCGAKRPGQIRETAGGAGWRLSGTALAGIERALAERGTPVAKTPV
jgi:aryl-alcohol dehydrogenase-like predicted oxidoreductase